MPHGNQGHCREFFGMANHTVTSVLTSIGTLTPRPAAFLILLAYAILWMIFERQSLDWHGAAITRIDDEEPEEIEKHRHRQQRGD